MCFATPISALQRGQKTIYYCLNEDGTEVPDIHIGDNGVVKLHISLDKSVLPVFTNDGLQSVTRVVYPGQRELEIRVFANDGTAIVKSLKAWELKGVW